MTPDTDTLTPLPEPQPRPGPDRLCGYSAAQMRDYGAQRAAAERERCARLCDQAEDATTSAREAETLRRMAAAIRSPQHPTPAEPSGCDSQTLERAADMLGAYAELVKAMGRYAEEHYVPEVEFIASELRAAAGQAKQPEVDAALALGIIEPEAEPALWAPEGLVAHEGADCRKCCLMHTDECERTSCGHAGTDYAHPSGRPVYFTRKQP